jgi:hypothetical protein
MSNYAVIHNEAVMNVIICDTKEIAESVTGKTCIELLPDSKVGIGWGYVDSEFVEPYREPEIIPDISEAQN